MSSQTNLSTQSPISFGTLRQEVDENLPSNESSCSRLNCSCGGSICHIIRAVHSPDCSNQHLSISPTSIQVHNQHEGSHEIIRGNNSSVDINSTPAGSDYLQVQPMGTITRYNQGQEHQQHQVTEHGHRVLVDGDAYTLVILDCSPQPSDLVLDGHDCRNSSQACDCRCYCQTELTVRQQTIPHDPGRQSASSQPVRIEEQTPSRQQISPNQGGREQQQSDQIQYHPRPQPQPQQPQQQQHQEHYQYLDVERRSYLDNKPVNDRANESPNNRQVDINDLFEEFYRQNNPAQGYHQTMDTTTETIVERQDTRYKQNPSPQRTSIQRVSPQRAQTHHPDIRHQQQYQESYPETNQLSQIDIQPEMQQVQRHEQAEQHMSTPTPSHRGGTRLVKKWNWNQQQFIYEEVPDRPVPKPQILSRSQKSHSSPTDVWHQEIKPSTSAANNQREPIKEPGKLQLDHTQYDPAWLSYRQPDVESVQSDPLYRDLMNELQRLEEGMTSRPIETPSVSLELETSQRPVFGQAVTPDRVEINEYDNVEFVCRLIPISDPTMKVEWTKNGKSLQESNRYTNEYEFGVVRLRIKRCEAEDSGIYQCKATNSLGQAISTASLRVHAKGNVQCETLNPAGLDKIRQLENPRTVDHVEEQAIEQPPKFLTHIVDYVEKEEGESVHFECCLAPVDDPDLKTEWLFNGRPLVTGSRFHTIDDFGFIVLDIDWLYPRDTGEYVCRATNRYGTDITRTVLRVKPDKNIVLDSQLDNPTTVDKLRLLEFPDVIQETMIEEPDKPAHFVQQLVSEDNKREFNEGDNVHFEARVGPATDGNLTVEWYHNDKPLISGHRFKPSFDFGHIILDILYVYAEDSGVYKCVTRNATGMDVSKFEIHVTGKPSLVYQSQLPKEMVGGVQKITEMEAMWNRAPDPEEEEEPAPRRPPEFVLKPKPCTAFENSCARFCCRIVGNPKPRPTWVVNGQTVVSGSRYKLTYDGMYHLIIPKCQLSDAGKVEVYARNLLGECFCTTELKVKKKVDDYRSVLKNSPNPWYDEQSLKMYQRQRSSQDLTDDEDFLANFQHLTQRLQFANEQQSTSPMGNQVIGYMEPGTPDVNLLARTQSPLVEPGDLHPVVTERQVVMAPAPSTIKRALDTKDLIRTGPEKKSFQSEQATDRDDGQQQRKQQSISQTQPKSIHNQDDSFQPDDLSNQRRVFGLKSQQKNSAQARADSQQQARANLQWSDDKIDIRIEQRDPGSFDPRLPPPSPENKDYGKEIHSQTHKQTQMERRANKQIIREIVEKETFEQEHSGLSKENVVRGDSVERGSTPSVDLAAQVARDEDKRHQIEQRSQYQQYQQSQQVQMQQQQQQFHHEDRQVLVEENMTPPEFIQKIQPCQAIDGDEARFECLFKGDPNPTISWFRENKMIKPSNLYSIVTDLKGTGGGKSTLIIKRVDMRSNAVYTVKAENVAGSAKSSANLVVEPHPLPQTNRRGGHARQVDFVDQEFQSGSDGGVAGGSMIGTSGETLTTYTTMTTTSASSNQQHQLQEQQQRRDDDSTSESDSQKIKSVRTRKLSADEMASLIRKSPEGLIAPTFLHMIHDTTVRPGDLARLDARLIGTQPMEVRWVKDGQRVRADKSHKMLLEGDLYTILILECSPRDEGNYECVASNRIGEARCGARLFVFVDGRQSSSKTPETLSDHSSGHLASVSFAGSSSSSSSQWQQPQVSSQQWSQSQSQSGSNSAGSQRTHFGVTKHQFNPMMAQYTPSSADQRKPEIPRVIKRLENQQVREGKSVTLRCQISSFPMAEVHWYKEDNKLIKPSKYFRIFKDNDETYCLKILETFPEDQGDYKCVAKAPNGQNQVETKATITVIPNSPR